MHKLGWLRCTALLIVCAASRTQAQAAADGAPPPVVSSPPVEPRVEPQPQRVEPPRPAPRPPGLVRIYGVLRPAVTFSGSAVESYGYPNASAITAAANPVLANRPQESRLTFQVAQSRFGLWVNEAGAVRGHLELDFIDFAKSSPTVVSLPRLRIAMLEWSINPSVMVAAGQDWDMHAPINPFGINLVGASFLSGNTGFMRQQIKALWKPLDLLELGFALGLQGANPSPKDAAVELARVPSFALRATALLGALGKLGVSGIATQLRLNPGEQQRRAFAGAVSVFGELTPTLTTAIRFEAYAGSNVANLGALGLGQGHVDEDVAELGGFVSVRQGFLGQHAVYLSLGHAHVPHASDVVASYSYPADSGATPAMSSAVLAGSGPGLRWNQGIRLGYELRPLDSLALVVEGFWYTTKHQLLAVDRARVEARRSALGLDVGMLHTF